LISFVLKILKTMPSFDIASKVELQNLDNAINVIKREIMNRFDLKDTQGSFDLNKKDLVLTIETENDLRLKNIEDIIISRVHKQNIDSRSFDMSKDFYPSGKMIKKEIKIRQGIDKETAKKIVKLIKDSGIKVQAAIMDDMVRVTAKKIDDLQEVIAMLRKSELELPLQYINMKS
jgi:cyclic-di-GMP-binding protein